MKKRVLRDRSRLKNIILTAGAVAVVLFIILPLTLTLFDGSKIGNVALIPIAGTITVGSGSSLGAQVVSSSTIVEFIEAAAENPKVEVILLEINSPGGSAVASDEIALAIKKVEKPVIALIEEVGASGGYWIASAADYIIINRMGITGSIGVISSYLEFSGLMDKYGVGYERLVSGERKDMGTPLKKLSTEEKGIFQSKLDKIHSYFIEEVANNRDLTLAEVEELATGEFFLGVEAYGLGLVDELGNKDTAEEYMKENYDLEDPTYVVYEKEIGLFEMFGGTLADLFFKIGEGLGTALIKKESALMLF